MNYSNEGREKREKVVSHRERIDQGRKKGALSGSAKEKEKREGDLVLDLLNRRKKKHRRVLRAQPEDSHFLTEKEARRLKRGGGTV